MTKDPSPPILITGVGKRAGLALAKYFLAQGENVIGTYRSHHPSLQELDQLGATLIYCDFYQKKSVQTLVSAVKSNFSNLKCLIHNASDWIPESSNLPANEVFEKMMRIHAQVPYALNLALRPLLEGNCGTSDIIHISDFVASTGSKKHIAYAASKAALENLSLSFAALYAPKIKVNSIAPALLKFNESDDENYQQKTLKKSLMAREGGFDELIATIDYLMASKYITGRVLHLDGGRHLK